MATVTKIAEVHPQMQLHHMHHTVRPSSGPESKETEVQPKEPTTPLGLRREKSHLIQHESARSAKAAIISGLTYCSASVTMVLVNKVAVSGFGFQSPTGLLLFQCLLCVFLVWICDVFQFVKRQRVTLTIVKMWLPVNVIFVCMIWTSFFALKYLSVPMVTVLKNLSNLFTILGDYYFYNRTYSLGVWSSLFLMFISAAAGMKTDLEFSFLGYVWQLVNCACTSGYSLYLRGVMDDVAAYTDDAKPLSEVSMVYLNNLLSVPLLLLLMMYNGEAWTIFADPVLLNPWFMAAALTSGLVAFFISFASLWFLSSSTPTTYSLVGSLNKVPVAVLSLFLFPDRNATNISNLLSVSLGLLAGVVFVHAKAVGRK